MSRGIWRYLLVAFVAILGLASGPATLAEREERDLPAGDLGPPIPWLDGPATAVAVQGQRVYLGEGSRLVTLDVPSPLRVREIGRSDALPGVIRGIAVSGAYAFVAADRAGLRVVQIDNPGWSHEVASYDTPGTALGIAFAGNFAYIADGSGGLRIVDVSDPTRPRETGFLATNRAASAVAVAGRYAHVVVGSPEGDVEVIDISNPRSPAKAGEYAGSAVGALGIALSGDHAYLTDLKGLSVVNVANPAHPVVEGRCGVQTSPYLAVSGEYVVIATRSGVRVINVFSPSNPISVGILDAPGTATGIAVQGNTAYVGGGEAGLRIIDFSNPSLPIPLATHDVTGYAEIVVEHGGYGYVATGARYAPSVLQIVQPSPSGGPPIPVGRYNAPGRITGLAVTDRHAYVATADNGVRIVDISERAKPVEVGRFGEAMSIQSITLAGRYAFVSDFGSGLRIIDISKPEDPHEIGLYPGTSKYGRVAIADGRAYVLDAADQLRILDVSNPSVPVETISYETPGQALSLDGSAIHPYIAADDGGLLQLTVGQPYDRQLHMSRAFVDVSATIVPTTTKDSGQTSSRAFSASFRKSVPRADGAPGPTPETAAVSETAAVLPDRMPHLTNDALSLGRALQMDDVEIRERELPSGTVRFTGRVEGTSFDAALTLAVTSFQPLTLSVHRFQIALPSGQSIDLSDIGRVTMTMPGETRFTLTTSPSEVAGIGGVAFTFTGHVDNR